jgi:hypothetical protein
MSEESRSPRREPGIADERPAASLLVRCWLEPQPRAEEAPILRGYVRNLKTGEETFIKDLESVGLQILRQLAPDGASEGVSLQHRASALGGSSS